MQTPINNFQRIGAESNSYIGSMFEANALAFFAEQGIKLLPNLSVPIGISKHKKNHKFDLGGEEPPVLVECKSHTWTQGGNMPSAKIAVWNEAMYYFYAAPARYRKILFVLRDHNAKRGLTLAEYYSHTYAHLIPDGVEIWEYNPVSKQAKRIH